MTDQIQRIGSLAGGAIAGAQFYSSAGGLGLVGKFGAVGLGFVPITTAGAVTGAAVYVAFKAIAEGDSVPVSAFGVGAATGAGASTVIGGMGLAGGFGAVSIGMGSMAAAGGIVGLGLYGIVKILDQSSPEPAATAFSRMEEKILWQEAYVQALIELTLDEDDILRRLLAIDIEDDLRRLKVEVERQKQPLPSPESTFPALFLPSKEGLPSQQEQAFQQISTQLSEFWFCVHTLEHHAAAVNAIAISPNGKTVATGSDDRTINLWDLETGKRIYTFLQSKAVLAVAISPNGETLIAGGVDQVLTFWNLRINQVIDLPSSKQQGILCALAFSADGRVLASGSGDQTIGLRDPKTGRLKSSLKGHTDIVFTIAISPDGSTLVSGSADCTIKVWDLTRRILRYTLTDSSGWINTVAISPDGQTFASGRADSTIQLRDLATGKICLTLTGHTRGVNSLAFSPDGKMLASSSNDGTIRLWQFSKTSEQLSVESLQILPGCGPIAFSPDSSSLVSTERKGKLNVWKKVQLGSGWNKR